GRPTQRLDFDTIKLWELDPEVFEQQGLVGLLPLLPLTKGSKNRETVTRMTEELEKAGRQDLFMVAYAISELVLTAVGDNEWLKARFFMQHDFLKNTWVFQHVRDEGKQEGLQEGLQEGKQEGEQKGEQKGVEGSLIQFVEIRFPTLLTLAKQI